MRTNEVFRINGPQVIYENIEGEVVLINLQRGAYYSTDQVGAELWELIAAGRSVGVIQAAVKARWNGDAARIEAAVTTFLSELLREELIVTEKSAGDGGADLAPDAGSAGGQPPFQPPVLNKYTDMKDMLLLDPIHDVEETGWPTPKAAP